MSLQFLYENEKKEETLSLNFKLLSGGILLENLFIQSVTNRVYPYFFVS